MTEEQEPRTITIAGLATAKFYLQAAVEDIDAALGVVIDEEEGADEEVSLQDLMDGAQINSRMAVESLDDMSSDDDDDDDEAEDES